MAADIKEIQKKAEAKMQASIEFLDESLAHIRAGKANPRILDGIKLDYYGSITPLSGVASISTPDARTIIVQPWEKSMMRDVEKAIMDSDVGITPDNNGEVIRLSIPPLTEERRKMLVKQSKQEAEDAKISIRNARRDAIDAIKKSVKDGVAEDVAKDAENDMQKIHDRFIKQIDEIFAAKEKEILTV
ncbi:MAG: ribosome recycling factor [Dysgonomonas sp.]